MIILFLILSRIISMKLIKSKKENDDVSSTVNVSMFMIKNALALITS